MKNQGERVLVRGKMDFNVLYRKSEGGLQALGGSISFEEPINVPGLEEKDYVQLGWDLEDLNAGMINSRKLSIKACLLYTSFHGSWYRALSLSFYLRREDPLIYCFRTWALIPSSL